MRKLLDHYLLANYGAGVQLSNVENERTLIISDFFIGWQCTFVFLSSYLLVFWRNLPYIYQLVGLGAMLVFVYKIIQPTYRRYFYAAGLDEVYRKLPRSWRVAYAWLGCGLVLGALVLVFAVTILREYYI